MPAAAAAAAAAAAVAAAEPYTWAGRAFDAGAARRDNFLAACARVLLLCLGECGRR